MNWLEIKTEKGQEDQVCDQLNQLLQEKGTAVVPKVQKFFRIQGNEMLEIRPLSAGGILIGSRLPVQALCTLIDQASLNTIVSIHSMQNRSAMALKELCNSDWIVEMSHGLIERQRTLVLDGPLKGKEALIKKINRHKRICELDVVFNDRTILAGLEITEKR